MATNCHGWLLPAFKVVNRAIYKRGKGERFKSQKYERKIIKYKRIEIGNECNFKFSKFTRVGSVIFFFLSP